MAWYPGAIRKKITAKNRARMRWYNRVNLHVAVSEAPSLFGYFNQKGIPDSHFYVRKDGTIEQMVDTAYQAYADLEGNDATISIETQGGVRNPNGEKWTAAQIDSLARIYAWAVRTHGIPLKLARDSIPTGDSSHGLSWHRLGIDGNFPDAWPLWGRQPGGMHYSHSRGKPCPGSAKIRQAGDVLARSKQLLNLPATPTASEEPDVELTDQIKLGATAKSTLYRDEISVGGALQYAAAGGWETLRRLARIEATQAGQTAAIRALAESKGIDPDRIEAAVKEAVNAAVKDALPAEITIPLED